MTVSSTQSYIEYNGDGTTTTFPIPFYFLLNSDISAMVADASGSVTEPVNGNDFTVTGAGTSGGGTLIANSAYPSGSTLLIYRNPPATQETKYYENGKFPAVSHEAALDKLTMLIQEYGWRFDSLALKKPSLFSKFYDAMSNRISNLGDPVGPEDAANKSYVDAVGAGANANAASLVAKEAEARETADALEARERKDADLAEASARAEGDASLQRQLGGNVPLESSAFSPISWHKQRIENSVDIPDNVNAWSFGEQMEIAEGQQVNIGDGSSWTIADGRVVEDEDLHNLIADTITTTDGEHTLSVAQAAEAGDDLAALTVRVTAEEQKVNDITHGGTGATTAASARTNLQAAASGANTDITSITGSAATLTTPRTIQTNLASTTASGFDGSQNISPGVTGLLPITNGGTGNATGLSASSTKLATARSILVNLASATGANFDGTAAINPGVTGALPLTNGGTGATTAAAARANLGAAASTGVTDASSAAAGIVGQVLEVTTTATANATSTAVNAAQLALTAGDWDVTGVIRFNSSSAPYTVFVAGLNTTSATQPSFPNAVQLNVPTSATTQQVSVPSVRFNVSANTTVYLVALAIFASGTSTVDGYIRARRIR